MIVVSAAPLHQGYGYSTLREFHTPLGAEAWGAENPRQMSLTRDLAVAAALDRLLPPPRSGT